jgi:hypothetical protein
MVDGLFAAGLPATRERSRKTRKELRSGCVWEGRGLARA